MRISIDGSVLQQHATGIAKTLLLLYENCHKLDPSLKIEALHRLSLMCKLPRYIHSSTILPSSPEVLWRNLLLPAYISKSKPDITHFPWNGNVPRFLMKTNVITTIHDVLPLEIPGYFSNNSERQLYLKKTQESIDRSDLIITISEYSKEQIIENTKTESELLLVYHGPTLDKMTNDNKTGEDNYFLYVGGYDPRKGIDILLKVLIKLSEAKKLHTKLILTGAKNYFSDELKYLIDKGLKLGIIEERGYVSDTELINLYSNALALVYPSKYEGFGLPPLEAMNLGCPVITTKCTSIPEICGESAYYIDVDDLKNFENALIDLENDENLRNDLKRKGIKQAAKFSWQSSAKIFLKGINNILR